MDQPKKQCQVLWSFLYKEIPKVPEEHATSKSLYFSCLLPLPHCLRLPSTWFSKMLFCWLTHRLYRAQCVWRSSWAHPLWAGSPISLAADASPSSKLFASCPSLVQTPASHGPDQMLRHHHHALLSGCPFCLLLPLLMFIPDFQIIILERIFCCICR